MVYTLEKANTWDLEQTQNIQWKERSYNFYNESVGYMHFI